MLNYTDSYEYLYSRNSRGYRCAEFDTVDWQRSTAVFGCSEVFGVSVPEDQTLTHYMSRVFGVQCINLGVPGVSNRTITDHMLNLFEVVPWVRAVVLWTAPYRRQYWNTQYKKLMDITPAGVYQPEHAEAVAEYRVWCSQEAAVRQEFRQCKRRVLPLPVSCFTVIGEPWQAPVIRSDIQCTGLDGSHSAGARNQDIAQQLGQMLL